MGCELSVLKAKFAVFAPRIEALGLSIEWYESRVRISGSWNYYPYLEECLASFEVEVVRLEMETAKAKAKIQGESLYQTRKAEGGAQGLPHDVSFTRNADRTYNIVDAWVIGPDGVDREPDVVEDLTSTRGRYWHGEGIVWEQILPGEVVIRWTRYAATRTHQYDVVHLPPEGVTAAQVSRIREIQLNIERKYSKVNPFFAGWDPANNIGCGWGL